MLVTKHAAELCALLVNDLYGELPSRILVALLTKGRSTIAQLAQYTSLQPRFLRNGLSVLIQQNLLYHHTDSDSKGTNYEANPDACYSLVRSGKILEAIESQYGTAERDLVQTLLQLGFARIADLTQAFKGRAPKSNGHTNGSTDAPSGLIESESHLNAVLGRLIQAEIIETMRADSFRNPRDIYREIEQEMTRTAPGEKTSKITVEQQGQIMSKYRTFKEQGKSLKRQLDITRGTTGKRRKLHNGRGRQLDDDLDAPPLNPNIVVRINHEKCLVELRNHRMATFAADMLGEVTGAVYRTLLDLLSVDISKCRADPLLEEETPGYRSTVTTMEIFQHLDESVNVQSGIGKAPKEKLDFQSAERIRPEPQDSDSDSDASDSEIPVRRPSATPRTLDIDMHNGFGSDEEHENGGPHTNGNGKPKVKFEDDGTSKSDRIEHMRQHLLLLAESKHRFVRHSGVQGRGQWTVDFSKVLNRLKEIELDAYIEQSFGRHGLRLTRILRERGKLDEKMLPSAALMKKSDVQLKMIAMQMAGLVDVQEVPKDNSRMANRTLFFWFFDRERTESQALDDIYKAMVRCLETLQVQRHKERNILSFVERKDVQGKEEEVMTTEHYEKYNKHLDVQERLLGQVMRLDEMVAVFRDY
ncbi:RNA polymerase III subunit Rpc82 [Cordyceps javanica]|uniref:DNA-directed RNA polymerase III subunit RPC3 n=1 Tax=Cordyceps javanica TaxID=43265 RepID=A0A545W4C6_9HYPO|nr:RNA polymerase III subunit Rpc82 [Cordyceps javanica]TQW08832.1 RNA polymerase III subunit Rpc82 [Cordyceps javanica]